MNETAAVEITAFAAGAGPPANRIATFRILDLPELFVVDIADRPCAKNPASGSHRSPRSEIRPEAQRVTPPPYADLGPLILVSSELWQRILKASEYPAKRRTEEAHKACRGKELK